MVVRGGHDHDGSAVVVGGASAGTHQDREYGGEKGAQQERCAKSRARADNWHAIKPFGGKSGSAHSSLSDGGSLEGPLALMFAPLQSITFLRLRRPVSQRSRWVPWRCRHSSRPVW